MTDTGIQPTGDPANQSARRKVDVSSVLRGAGLPWVSIADRVETAYDDALFHGASLQDLPEEPRFVFNSTYLESGC